MRVVLTWGENPRDLDAHMIDSENNLNNYSNPEIGEMILEADDTDGFGPEVTRVDKLNNGKEYMYYVNNYSSGSYGTLEKVDIYYGDSLLKSISISTANGDKESSYWKVFSVVGKENLTANDINVYNDLVSSDPSTK